MQNSAKSIRIDDKIHTICGPGVVKDQSGIQFSIAVPNGKQPSLLLYHISDPSENVRIGFPLSGRTGNIFSLRLAGLDWRNYRYNYEIDGKEVQDPYAHSVKDGQCILDFSPFNWGAAEKPQIPYEDGIMYHLHVRNYTMHPRSGVRRKGTFAGLQEKIPYLKGLGINQVILMPVHDFDEAPEVPEQDPKSHGAPVMPQQPNYWGYKKGFYFAPKRGYAASDDPVREFKTMVKAFHANGIEVIPEFYFDGQTPVYMQLDCLKYWVSEYRIDGVRIMGNTPLAGLIREDPYFADVKILCYYVEQDYAPADQTAPRQLSEMNDAYMHDLRRILKGDEGALESFIWRTRRNPSGFAVLNYLTGHDGFTLQDVYSYDRKHNEDNHEENRDGTTMNFSWNCGAEGPTRKKTVNELRSRMKKNAVLALMLSQGTPVLLAGDEFCNSQNGNNNPYCLDNEISWVDWSGARRHKEFLAFVQNAVAFRKALKAFGRKEEYRLADYKAAGYPDLSYHSEKAWFADHQYSCRTVGMLYCGKYYGEEEFVYAGFNFDPEERQLALPKLPEGYVWSICADTSAEDVFAPAYDREALKEKLFTLPARSILVFRASKA